MSYDVVVWEGEAPADDDEAGEKCSELLDISESEPEEWEEPSPAMGKFVASLLQVWPDISDDADADSPWATGPLLDEVTGPLIYIPLVQSRAGDSEKIAEMAREQGLVFYDLQAESMLLDP